MNKIRRGINSAKTMVGNVIAHFSLRQKQRGLKSAKTMVGNVVAIINNVVAVGNNVLADFSLRLKSYFKKPIHSKARYHLFGIVIGSTFLTIGLILGGYKIYKAVHALTESTKSMPTDVAFNRGVSGGLAGYNDGSGTVSVLSSEVRIATSSAWWNSSYLKRKAITLNNL